MGMLMVSGFLILWFMKMNPSKYQQAVFDFVSGEKTNGIVNAVAGSGKTTTMELALKKSDPTEQIMACAFNKHIADNLKTRVPSNCLASTLNSFGAKQMGPLKLKFSMNKVDNIIKFEVLCLDWADEKQVRFYFIIRSSLIRIVDLLRNLNKTDITDWRVYADQFDINIPNVENFECYLADTFNLTINSKSHYDFTDQMYFPVHRNLPLPLFDTVWVDESQDLNPLQMELIRRASRRVIAVGDPHQAIYGFRGADPYAMQNIKDMFACKELPLSICYRCSKSVVREAQKIVPHIEYHDSAPEGIVDTVKDLSNIKDGDWVLCRTTAPLVTKCLRLISAGRKAVVKGKEIGDDIIDLINDLTSKRTVPAYDLELLVEDYKHTKVSTLTAAGKVNQAIAIGDRCDAILAFCERGGTSFEIKKRIGDIFTNNDSEGIMLCTIHRSKGLEADNVYILRRDLLPHPSAKLEWQKIQEDNLHYVAITRAKRNLFYCET